MQRQSLRPSQIIMTFGPGSIVDLPDDSVMITGIEHWFDSTDKMSRCRKISEPRLERILGIDEFRMPPVDSYERYDVPFVRFPLWRVCPGCSRLSNRFVWPRGQPELPRVPRCTRCNRETYPARIIVACTQGHIDDFPWYRWIHRGQNCRGNELFLGTEGQSASLRVDCSCGRSRSLAGALGKDAMADAKCSCQGRRPWLGGQNEQCTEPLYALLRGASNVYFSVTRSALSIPPWSGPLQAEVAARWRMFPVPPTRDDWPTLIPHVFPHDDPDEVVKCLERLMELDVKKPLIRREEYEAFIAEQEQNSPHFVTRKRELSPTAAKFAARLVAVSRLREVRALLAFTRINAPEMDPVMELIDEEQDLQVALAPLSAKPLNWLPAIENLGEGIFLELNEERLAEWESLPAVRQRAEVLLASYSNWRRTRGLQDVQNQGPRLILLHTLAHLFIRQMSLDSGYSSASLRERIYSDEQMYGILIYTSTPDSDGSLGGLVRQTRSPEGFCNRLMSSVELGRICSNDPLCREHDPGRTQRLNGAACHACTMVSETSCEFGNRLLDRAMIVTLPNQSPTGYFDHDE